MTKEFRARILKEIIVDTEKYRYAVKQNTNTWRYEIRRLPIELLDTTGAINGWEVIEVLEDAKMTKYIVISQRKDGNGDVYQYLHDTLEAANADADMRWRYLTDHEQEKNEILVVSVNEDDLDPTFADEDSEGWDGERDWFAYNGYRVIRNLERQMWMEIMVDDWLADHHDEMTYLIVDWDYFDPDEMSVVAEDDKYTYSLYAIDGDIHIATLGTK